MPAQTRQLLPKRMTDLPEWEVTVDRAKIGRIVQEKIGKSRSVFFHAYGVHDGREYDLELSTDFDERVHAIERFWAAPEESVHYRQWR